MTDLRTDFICKLVEVMSNDKAQIACNVLDSVLHDYIVTKKSYEVSKPSTYMTNETMIKNFLGVKKLQGCSDTTLKQYRNALLYMCEHMQKSILEMDTNDIRYYLAEYQTTHDVTIRTIDNIRSYLSSFFAWASGDGYIGKNPMMSILPIKFSKPHISAFTDVELERIRCACTTTRDRALVEFLYSTGLRVSECCNVKLADIDWERKTVFVPHGKGNKPGRVYLSEIATMWLNKYLIDRGYDPGSLWLGRRGPLTKGGIEAVVTRIGESAGLHVTPHIFRHTFATNLVKRGVPLQKVQKLLRHDNISTTLIYIDVDDSDIKHAHDLYMG